MRPNAAAVVVNGVVVRSDKAQGQQVVDEGSVLCLIERFEQRVQKCAGMVVARTAVSHRVSAQAELFAYSFRTSCLGAL
ncbi:hypothetical protein Bdiaspc4_36800 [Bradyrhizobium diazoefficiens]|nr:hypothetical protein AAV28_32490 [Bradyrhizobium diazoefficiens USDA 110]MDA9392027.1 hypothetical protein [Bradyrhizobium sp. CCBAU 45394]PDT61880.1 hypothetical protein CO678_13205 [Bradyrhizobium diazoefficiens]QBP25718.1 hypothetical protein Bdiaspc4_36800 [Bradyrhizobium diazoefficiens]